MNMEKKLNEKEKDVSELEYENETDGGREGGENIILGIAPEGGFGIAKIMNDESDGEPE